MLFNKKSDPTIKNFVSMLLNCTFSQNVALKFLAVYTNITGSNLIIFKKRISSVRPIFIGNTVVRV